MPPRPDGAIALLRGINVGGMNRLPMAELRAIALECGFTDATTYLQSGNLVLPMRPEAPHAIAAALTIGIERRTGLDIAVVVRTWTDWAAVVAGNPFGAASSDGTRVHVMFLPGPATEAVRNLDPTPFGPDALSVSGSEVYLSLPNGIGRSKLAAALARIDNTDSATTRNWNTVTALAARAQRAAD